MISKYSRIFLLFLLFSVPVFVLAQDHGHAHDENSDQDHNEHTQEAHGENESHEGDHHAGCGCDHHEEEEEYNPTPDAFHHIADANAYHVVGDIYVPLPCMLYAPESGWTFLMSNDFDYRHNHGTGKIAIDRYVLNHGEIMRINDPSFPEGEVKIDCITHGEGDSYTVNYKGTCYPLDYKSTVDGGLFGGGITSFYDFSITKNIFTMLLTFLLIFLIFRAVAKGYKTREGNAPKGIQSLVEPIFLFIRDEVAIPFLGHKYERFLPFLMSIFFFILGLNLIGQIPFFPGSANVSGALAVTGALAIITFILVNINGNGHYWQHIFWMPGVPVFVKPLLAFIEILSLFIKPLTLMLRLAANITAGHIVIFIFVALIFIFGNAGQSMVGTGIGTLLSVPLTLFMMTIELIVAFVQAFVFTILTASYIGAAIEEQHH